jgi:hypothetical protein
MHLLRDLLPPPPAVAHQRAMYEQDFCHLVSSSD